LKDYQIRSSSGNLISYWYCQKMYV